jgi:DNA polymerase III subunit delta'
VAIIPLYGHRQLRDRFREAIARDTLPASLLLQGPRGIGKQRLALWLGQLLLCTGAGERPCGACQSCRYASELAHPDLHWFFPRPRLKDADASTDEVRDDYREGRAERAKAHGLYAPPSGSEGIFVATVRAIVGAAAMAPALGRRKVFVVGDAERMVPQEGADQAANAFLKLLEEPPTATTLIVTSSEPGALLPTIRSRVVVVRVPPLADDDVRAFLADEHVAATLAKSDPSATADDRLRKAAGAPGSLLGASGLTEATAHANRLLEAALSTDPAARYTVAVQQGVANARGGFSDMLDALTTLIHQRTHRAVARADERGAAGAARAVEVVERAKELAAGNVNPQLVTASLVRELGTLLR